MFMQLPDNLKFPGKAYQWQYFPLCGLCTLWLCTLAWCCCCFSPLFPSPKLSAMRYLQTRFLTLLDFFTHKWDHGCAINTCRPQREKQNINTFHPALQSHPGAWRGVLLHCQKYLSFGNWALRAWPPPSEGTHLITQVWCRSSCDTQADLTSKGKKLAIPLMMGPSVL